MERNTTPAKKKYDLSAIDELFKDVEEGATDLFKCHMGTLYVLYKALEDVKELETPS